MAVTDDVGAAPPAGFERQPPQDIPAEQSVLGGMLLSKDAIADVVEVLRSPDFYRPAHQLIYDTILDLYGRGEPADPITIAAELTRTGQLPRVGGSPYLHTLVSSVPTAANAGYYAEIVSERAILRRLVEAGTRIVQLGYGAASGQGGDVDEVVDRAQAEIYDVTERRMSEDYVRLEQLLQGTMDEIDAIASRGGAGVGVPTGFAELDERTHGLHAGQMVVIAARPAVGKALALDTPLPTPTGWTTMGDAQIGDQLIGADGRPTTIVAATEVMYGRPCYEVEFSDGTVIVADGQHQWLTWDASTRKAYDHAAPGSVSYPGDWPSWAPSRSSARPCAARGRDRMRAAAVLGRSAEGVQSAEAVQQQWHRPAPASRAVSPRTTTEIAATLRVRGQRNHAIPAARPIECLQRTLLIDPYVFGHLLGAGDTTGSGRVACDPQDRDWLIEEFAALGYDARPHRCAGHFGVREPGDAWRSLGMETGKHIPDAYLRGSHSQRLALVQGLVDSGGHVDDHGAYRFANTSRRLVDGFCELVVSLGCIPQVRHRAGRTRERTGGSGSWEVIVPAGLPLARMPRRALSARRAWTREQTTRYITDVRSVASVPVRCVEVDSADHLYLASRSMIPTHNSTLALDVARSCSIKNGLTSVIFSLEMSKSEITMRLLSAEAKVPLHHMRSGHMSDDDWARLARRMGEVAEAPLYVDDSPNLTMMEIRAKARRLKQRNDLRLVVVDYLQLMTSGKRVESRQQEVSEFSRSLKLLAKELEVPVIAISQLNRSPEQRQDKKPMLADLRECLAGDVLVVRADTGERVPIKDLAGLRNVPVWTLDERLRLRRGVMVDVWCTGFRPVYRLTFASGRQITATTNHPLLTVHGWRPVEALQVGDHVATARAVPSPTSPAQWSDDHVVLLAHLLGDGCVTRSPVYYCSRDEANLQVTEAAARRAFGVVPRRTGGRGVTYLYFSMAGPTGRGLTNPLYDWLRGLGLYGKPAHRKQVPAAVHSFSDDGIRLFLRHLWATDGSVTVRSTATGPRVRIYYATTSSALAIDVQALLLRLGMGARLRRSRPQPGARQLWTVDVSGQDDMLTFLTTVGVHGERGERCRRALEVLEGRKGNPNADVVPPDAWDYVRKAMRATGITTRMLAERIGMSYCGSTLYKHGLSRQRMARVAAAVPDPYLASLATSDVRWDRIVSIEAAGDAEVFDALVPGTHSFLANDVISHNSGAIEQDSDLVILLHREDIYERESPRAGEADLILAKHRNGPTGTVTVAFQGHYSRFVDMAT